MKKTRKKTDLVGSALAVKGVGGLLKEVCEGLFSKDSKARRMSALFFLSLIGIGLVGVLGWERTQISQGVRAHPVGSKGVEHLGEFIGKQSEDARKKHTVAEIGTFLVEIKKPPEQKVVKGIVNMAEVDITVECDLKETCNLIEARLPAVRDQVTPVLVAIDRDELMSKEGKLRLRRMMIERLNLWLPKGKVENLYFTRLIFS